jgi:hypothetical protein
VDGAFSVSVGHGEGYQVKTRQGIFDVRGFSNLKSRLSEERAWHSGGFVRRDGGPAARQREAVVERGVAAARVEETRKNYGERQKPN